MNNSDFSKAFNLTENIIDIHIPCGSIGIFLLGYTIDHGENFNPLYIGRSDNDLNETLKKYIEKYSQFKFCLFNSISKTFINECKHYHLLEDEIFLINESHPSPPPGLSLKCPVCGK